MIKEADEVIVSIVDVGGVHAGVNLKEPGKVLSFNDGLKPFTDKGHIELVDDTEARESLVENFSGKTFHFGLGP